MFAVFVFVGKYLACFSRFKLVKDGSLETDETLPFQPKAKSSLTKTFTAPADYILGNASSAAAFILQNPLADII